MKSQHLFFFKNETKSNLRSTTKITMNINNTTNQNLFYKNDENNSDIIIYKGEPTHIKDIINNYKSSISDIYKEEKEFEGKRAYKFLSVKELPKDPNLLPEIKKKLLEGLSKGAHKIITKLETVFIKQNGNFGNSLIAFNNILFYCELLGCKKIIFYKNNPSMRKWHIRKTIYLEKLN